MSECKDSPILTLAANYNHVPMVPNDTTIAILLESHPGCTVLAQRLEPALDSFILHAPSLGSKSKCPRVLIDALVQIFPNQVQQQYTNFRLP